MGHNLTGSGLPQFQISISCFGGVRGAVSKHSQAHSTTDHVKKGIRQEPEAHLEEKDTEGASTVLRPVYTLRWTDAPCVRSLHSVLYQGSSSGKVR